jgi:hypothetical protein
MKARYKDMVTIETSNIKVTVDSIEELKQNTMATPVSNILAKRFGFKPEDCEIWNGNLFVYNQAKNIVLVYDFFTKERKMYDFNIA